jgi:hypothetical protein
MSKTNNTSKLGHAALEDHRALGDTELDAESSSAAFPMLPVSATVMKMC